MENPNTPETPPTPTRSGPGSLLYQARLDLHLAPEDVAQRLHLPLKHVIALEKDDYERLPGPTYVRSYLRNYAQLLGLSPEKVLEAYSGSMTPVKPAAPTKSVPAPQITSQHRLVRSASALVAVVVLGLVVTWWFGQEDAPSNPSPPAAGVNESAAAKVDTEVPTTDSKDSGRPDIIKESAPSGKTNTDAARAATEQSPKVTPAAEQATLSGMILNVPPVDPGNAANQPPPAIVDRGMVRPGTEIDIPPGATRSRLVLRAVEDSWADIRDVHDNKLLYETIRAGRAVTVEGLAPFNVFLGNADGVKVEFNGRSFNTAQHKRGQIARFTLSERGGNE